MTPQRFFESVLYILRYDFRDLLDEFPDLLLWHDGIPQHGPSHANIIFRSNDYYVQQTLGLDCDIEIFDCHTINRDLKKQLYIHLNENRSYNGDNLIGRNGHLTDFGDWIAGGIDRIIAYIETDSFPFVTVQYFEITEDGIDEYKNHIEDIRAYLEQEYKKYRT